MRTLDESTASNGIIFVCQLARVVAVTRNTADAGIRELNGRAISSHPADYDPTS